MTKIDFAKLRDPEIRKQYCPAVDENVKTKQPTKQQDKWITLWNPITMQQNTS